MNLRILALAIITSGAISLVRPAHANVDPPSSMKICAVDVTGDGSADSWCIGRNGCYIGPSGCYAW